MTIRNCPECGKIFEFVFKTLCPECAEQDEADLLLIKDYLLCHSCATISEIAQETGVAARKVFRLLRDRRLTVVCEKNKIQILNCERCQKPVLNERFCPECREYLSAILGKMSKENAGELTDSRKTVNQETISASPFTVHFSR